MTLSPYRAAWLLFAAASWTSRTANALSIPVKPGMHAAGLSFFERAAAAATPGCISGFNPCTGFNLPSDFCCSAGSVCNVLAGNTTVVCCPEGQNCNTLAPIICDISQQDPVAHPQAPIKTSALNGVLTKCGTDTCCPFGYNCNSDGVCVVESNQNAVPLQNVPVATSSPEAESTLSTIATTFSTSTSTSTPASSVKVTTTPSPTTETTAAARTTSASLMVSVATSATLSTSTTAASSTGSRTGAESNESAVASADDSSNGGNSTASVVGGIIGGLAGLLLIGAAIWFLCGRRLRRSGSGKAPSIKGSSMRQRDPSPNFLSDNASRLRRSTVSFGKIIKNPLSISSPKPQSDATAFRTDFIRKPPSLREISRPSTPASSIIGTINISISDHQPTSVASPLSMGQSMGRDLPPPPSPAPPPLVVTRASPRGRERDSFSVAPIRGMRSSPPRQQMREPSMEINVGADPSLISLGIGNFTISPQNSMLPPPRAATTTTTAAAATAALASVTSAYNPSAGFGGSSLGVPRDNRNSRSTTFSSLLHAADLDPEQPYVPYGARLSPAPQTPQRR
ncbi:MAG: hypothetical protein STHCBS139747_002884 [Sporothrix thermara]